MEQEKICFVSMPIGKKDDPYTGRQFDFDQIYRNLVLPAAADAGYQTVRVDEFAESIILRPLLQRVITSDVFIADLTTANPNVMYELGLRHALSKGATVLLMASGTRLPFDVSSARVILYKVDDHGNPIEGNEIRRFLTEAIRQGIGRTGSDSPVYGYFPDLHVEMPSEFVRGGRQTRPLLRQTARGGTLPPGLPSAESLKQADKEIRRSKEVDPASALEVLKGYQVTSAWQDLIEFSSALPQNLREMPQVQQMTALALNRLGRSAEAVVLLRSLIARTGGDSDSYGILGQIYKGLYSLYEKREYLEQAIDSYRSAFNVAPNDYYSGMNLVRLLVIYGGDETQNELNDLVPSLRAQLDRRIADPRADYWDVESAFELTIIARDWPAAYQLQQRMLQESPADWMLQVTVSNLDHLGKSMGKTDQTHLQGLVNTLTERQSNA